MIKLNVKPQFYDFTTHPYYFHTMEECKKFMRVFSNHWCEIPWADPVELPDGMPLSDKHRNHMNLDPIKRAETNLNWGFRFVERHHLESKLELQCQVERMMAKIYQ